ncbi:hypothetical protein CKM354_000753600 [Cercospora kikuchii]|uniref:FAD dependent oxidoreductase domain-containing protein n=1 Tax=Cercospora kikuchii TaxID=84275 RepID=A0A9P3CRB3_9PEZI|nr:uncharacterized protein CKM354_000753600 [Cercospora kikuchii]GIZ44335.1 hypothetical protein CKM354_000753600 [Cercospora kikuchii]
MTSVPASIIAQLVRDAQQDPQLPRANPTEAFWQLPPSSLSDHQSRDLPSKTTYAIIGSGITACSVARNLFENLTSDSNSHITILEARTLCSGATGRNGGHLVSPFPEEFSIFEKYAGKEATMKMARFANRTLESMHRLAEDGDEELKRVAEVRRVRSVCAYYDAGVFEETKKSMRRYEECLPEEKGDGEFYGAEEAREKWNFKDAVGVIVNRAGAFWPYRLVTGLFERMLEKYTGRFALETNTPVTGVEYDASSDKEYPYSVQTSRGVIRASKVIYCSNGFTGHLLPKMRGKIWPLRGTMSAQAAGPDFPNEGDSKSWSTFDQPKYDPKTGQFSYGLYYITQNAKTGDIFIGGEKQHPSEILNSDDTVISSVSKDALVNVLPKIFDKGWPEGQAPEVRKCWSGVMGFTVDAVPWVGEVPESITGRPAGGECIAAGFNGYGMPLCWGCGEAVAKMLLGKKDEVMRWLPENFLITDARLKSPYSMTEAGIYTMLMQEPPLMTMARIGLKNIASRLIGKSF